jgi:hypothetical protein
MVIQLCQEVTVYVLPTGHEHTSLLSVSYMLDWQFIEYVLPICVRRLQRMSCKLI